LQQIQSSVIAKNKDHENKEKENLVLQAISIRSKQELDRCLEEAVNLYNAINQV
jgi:hypothetical protein